MVAFAAAALIVRLARISIARFVGRLDHLSAGKPRGDSASGRRRSGGRFALFAYGIAAVVSVSLGVERLGLGRTALGSRGRQPLVPDPRRQPGGDRRGCGHREPPRRSRHRTPAAPAAFPAGPLDFEWQRRASTIAGLLQSLVAFSLGFVAVLMVLRELAIDVLPVLTGAGIAGLAVGFGAQNLVRDIISGFFLILEDQVRMGDQARINGVMGTVEDVRLRTIVLRDGDGAVQVFPNGSITSLANLSKQFVVCHRRRARTVQPRTRRS